MAPSFQSIFAMSSSATGRVEKATSRLLINSDWMLNMDICNSINSDPWKAKEFVKAVKMRLQNKNPKVQFLALTLLETMIKKCDDFVHFQVVERGILSEMVKIARKSKNNEVKEKILVLLETWQAAFNGSNGRYPQFYNTYDELKRSGFQFPGNPKKADQMLSLTGPIVNEPQINCNIPTNPIGRPHEHFSLSDLHNIQNVMELFNNMLDAVNPNDQKVIKGDAFTNLLKQCDINQKKLVQLINSTEKDPLLAEILTLNDSLQTALSKHAALVSESSLPPGKTSQAPQIPSLSAVTVAESSQFDGKVVEEEEEDDDDDGFSALAKRNSINNSITTGTSAKNSLENLTSVSNNALVVPDQPAPASSARKGQDMLDLLSFNWPPRQSQQNPQLLSPTYTLIQNQNPFTDSSLIWEQYPTSPHPLASNNEGYASPNYHGYVVPWARSYPAATPSLEISPIFSPSEGSSNPFLSAAYIEHPAAQAVISNAQKFCS